MGSVAWLLWSLSATAVAGEVPSAAGDAIPSTTAAASPAATQPLASEHLQSQLDRHLPKLDITAVPISDVFDLLSDRGVTIHVNWRSIEALQAERLRVERSTPVTLTIRDQSHASLLDALLEKADESGERRIWWCADENVVVVAARSDLPHYREIKDRIAIRRWDEDTRAALASRVASLRMDAFPLPHALSLIREQINLEITMDRAGLNRSGIDPDGPIIMKVRAVTGREVAALLLFDLDPQGRLALAPRGGKSIITPREAFRRNDPPR